MAKRAWGAMCAALVGLGVMAWWIGGRAGPAPMRDAPASELALHFVGEAACASCHAEEAAAWTGSHHQLAMQPASASTVLGDFADARFTHAGIESRFFRRGDAYVIRTDGPDGALHDYDVRYTFGVAPLQQYLVAFPRGRFQSPELAWDSRPVAQGGQRWFHLYPGERIAPGDPLHWTGPTENWNYMCADCHSTNVRKWWSAQTSSYTTTFAEVAVSCEACHGPGSRHVAWARQPADRRARDDGLAIALDERAGVFWPRDPVTDQPVRSRPRTTAREIEMCARCHARRGLIHEDTVHGQPVGDDYRVALLDEGLYYPDGQIRGEVYEYGSFLQSRMFAAGVTCSDCHDPHRATLRAPGDALCLQCHAAKYATKAHHFHDEASAGARCVSCHMPAATYMVVDPRRDHSIRVPRPDLSVRLGVPNACNGCHADRSAAWAEQTVEAWYGHVPSGFQQFADALAAGERGAPDAQRLLVALADDHRQPAIARASAVAQIRPDGPAAFAIVRDALSDDSALVRGAAIHALAQADPRVRAALVTPLLDDPVRVVRLDAAEAMAGVPAELLPPAHREARDRAIAELVAAQQLNGDRPEAHLALANLYASERDLDRARAELERAIAIDPGFAPASVNLADLDRATGRDADAERVLREALARAPDVAALQYALGLARVREHPPADAGEARGRAAHLAPDEPRYGYVLAVALHDTGQRPAAVHELEDVLRTHPENQDALDALDAYRREADDAPVTRAPARRARARARR